LLFQLQLFYPQTSGLKFGTPWQSTKIEALCSFHSLFRLFQETYGNNPQRKQLKNPVNPRYYQQEAGNPVSDGFRVLSFVRQNNLQEGEQLRCQDRMFCSEYCLFVYPEWKNFDDFLSGFRRFVSFTGGQN
ncbi:MAG: hypothetical protein ACOC30_03125, partial [Marinilabilia sp.]